MSVAGEVKQLRELLEAHIALQQQTQRSRIQARPRDPEDLDPIPLAIPVDNSPPSMRELVQEYVEDALSKHAIENDMGTFAEEDDFEEEDPELLNLSGFEVQDYEMEEEIPIADASPPPESPATPSNEGTPTSGTPPPEPEPPQPAPPAVGTT